MIIQSGRDCRGSMPNNRQVSSEIALNIAKTRSADNFDFFS